MILKIAIASSKGERSVIQRGSKNKKNIFIVRSVIEGKELIEGERMTIKNNR